MNYAHERMNKVCTNGFKQRLQKQILKPFPRLEIPSLPSSGWSTIDLPSCLVASRCVWDSSSYMYQTMEMCMHIHGLHFSTQSTTQHLRKIKL